METRNGVPTEFGINISQTAKGVFVVEKISIYANTEDELVNKTKSLLERIKKTLEELNTA